MNSLISAANRPPSPWAQMLSNAASLQEAAFWGKSLVPIYLGQGVVEAAVHRDRDAIDTDLGSLDAAAAALPSGLSKVFLEGMLKSLRGASRC